MQRRRFRTSLPYLLPSGTGTTLFYTAPFLVMLLYAFSGGGGLAALGGNHAFAVGARNTAVYLFCGIGTALLLGMWIALALRPRRFAVKLALLVPLMIVSSVSWFVARFFEPNSIYRKALVENNLLDDDRDRTMLRRLPVRSRDRLSTPLQWPMAKKTPPPGRGNRTRGGRGEILKRPAGTGAPAGGGSQGQNTAPCRARAGRRPHRPQRRPR